jgi:hypothetical protein
MTRRRARSHSPASRRGGRGHPQGLDGLGLPRRLALAAAMVASIGLTVAGVAGASRRQPAPTEMERQVQGEIDAMIESGVPEDDPKVEMLEDQVDELRRSDRADPPREPGVDLRQRVADARAAERAADRARDQAGRAGAGSAASADVAGQVTAAGVPTGPAWQRGTVECEPVPQALTADEVAGAICVSVPQPDGSTRYVAVGRDGVVRTVAFGADGKVGRGPDRRVPGGVTPGATSVGPTPAGDIRVVAQGKAPVTVDVG